MSNPEKEGTFKTLVDYGFKLQNPCDVVKFVEANPQVLNVLSQAKIEIEKQFNNPLLLLYCATDHETGIDFLNIQIVHDLNFKEAFDKEGLLFDDWFAKHYVALKGIITLREYHRSCIIIHP